MDPNWPEHMVKSAMESWVSVSAMREKEVTTRIRAREETRRMEVREKELTERARIQQRERVDRRSVASAGDSKSVRDFRKCVECPGTYETVLPISRDGYATEKELDELFSGGVSFVNLGNVDVPLDFKGMDCRESQEGQ